jgi:hypothetical protein
MYPRARCMTPLAYRLGLCARLDAQSSKVVCKYAMIARAPSRALSLYTSQSKS